MAGGDSHTLADDIRRIYDRIEENHGETMKELQAVKLDVTTLATKFAVDEQKHVDCRKVVMGNGVAPVATRLTRLEIGLALAAIGALVAGIVGVLSPYVWIGHFTR
jgi:hypothetical protein